MLEILTQEIRASYWKLPMELMHSTILGENFLSLKAKGSGATGVSVTLGELFSFSEDYIYMCVYIYI